MVSTLILGVVGSLGIWNGIIIVGLLVVALRGTQNQMTLREVQQTQWYSYLCHGAEVFAPPELPEEDDISRDTQREKDEKS